MLSPLLIRRPTVAVAPVGTAAAAVIVGAGLLILQRIVQHSRRFNHPSYAARDWSDDLSLQRLNMSRLSNDQLIRYRQVLDTAQRDSYRLPLSGVLIDRTELNRELLRRSGQGGFIFIPPAAVTAGVPALVQAGRWAVTAAAAWLIAKGLLNWGSINSPGPQLGPAETVPLWWPTGFYNPNGPNTLYFTQEITTVQPTSNCQPMSSRQDGAMDGGWGRVRYHVWDGLPTGAQGPCGNQIAPEVEVGWFNPDGTEARRTISGSNEYVLRNVVTALRVEPSGNAPAAAPYPEWEPSVQPLPDRRLTPLPATPAPRTIPEPATEPRPERAPDGEPAAPPVPVVPGQIKVAPPQIGVPGREGPVRIPGGVEIGQDGKPVPDAKPVPGTTPVDQEIPWPGGQPIGSPAQRPRPSLEGIAQEVGRIEKKLAQMNTPSRPPAGQGPGGLSDLIGPLWDLLSGLTDQGSYAISSECVPDGEIGSPGMPYERVWGSSFGRFGSLEKRVDALAGLLQDHKALPSRTCRKPIPTGEWVMVNFESQQVSPSSNSRLRKVLRYLDQNSGSLEAHVDHWRGFEWDAGPWIVIHKGAAWGVPQVWAASAEEGKRVLRHAAAIAGVDTEQSPGEWVVQRSSSPRYGFPGRMSVRRGRNLIWMVSKREGPAGPAEYLRPG